MFVACFSTTENGFDPKPVRVISVVGKMALDTVCLRALQFRPASSIPQMLHIHISLIY
jgi:hypothetical protein